MKLNLFEPNRFRYVIPTWGGLLLKESKYVSCEDASDVGNKIVNDVIQTLPLVYTSTGIQDGTSKFSLWDGLKSRTYTHQARLICIEPIENKDECSHKSPYINQDNMAMDIHTQVGARHIKNREIICLNCGKKLKAKWEANDLIGEL